MQSIRPFNKQRAFSLIEVLVAMVVLSVGLLGIAALYVTTLRSGSSSISRMQAVNLAVDLSDRIRANSSAQAAYSGLAATAEGCLTGTCTPAQMAANDLFVWQSAIAALLPGVSSGTVTFVAGPPSTYTITIQWMDPGTTFAQSYKLVMQL